MITATLRIRVSDGSQGEVHRLLRSMIGPTSVETGCISCRLYQDVDDPKFLTWIEEWSTEGDLRRHLRSPQYRKVLAAIDMSDVQPEIRFDTVVETQGMQLIVEARGTGG